MAAEIHELADLAPRLHGQVSKLLDQLEGKGTDGKDEKAEEITMPQRINALIAIGRILTIFANLRRKKDRERDDANAGSKVKQFSSAFAENAARRRATGTGDAVPEPDALDLGADDPGGDDDEDDD